jgi:hypothetical protein
MASPRAAGRDAPAGIAMNCARNSRAAVVKALMSFCLSYLGLQCASKLASRSCS